jgi:hypothetical protein
MSTIKEVFSAIIQKNIIAEKNIIGCDNNEISIVEKHFSCRLPQAYKDFLSIAGKGAGSLFEGTDIFYPRVLELQSEAKDLLVELRLSHLLLDDAKVFCMHQGYEMNFFKPISDDPEIFQFFEGNTDAVIAWQTFSEFIIDNINIHFNP